jgi:hypothetical protein
VFPAEELSQNGVLGVSKLIIVTGERRGRITQEISRQTTSFNEFLNRGRHSALGSRRYPPHDGRVEGQPFKALVTYITLVQRSNIDINIA